MDTCGSLLGSDDCRAFAHSLPADCLQVHVSLSLRRSESRVAPRSRPPPQTESDAETMDVCAALDAGNHTLQGSSIRARNLLHTLRLLFIFFRFFHRKKENCLHLESASAYDVK